MEMKYGADKMTDEIRDLNLSTGAELVGFASDEKLEKGAPKGYKPSDLMLNACACGWVLYFHKSLIHE